MTDFQYDSYDISSLKTAFENLNKAETQGFWLGVLGGAPIGYWLITRKSLQNKFKAGPISMTISSLAVGSLLYNLPYSDTELIFSEPDKYTMT